MKIIGLIYYTVEKFWQQPREEHDSPLMHERTRGLIVLARHRSGMRTVIGESFGRIMHDPPTLKLAGELYSGAFYRELCRILKRGGQLFHSSGDPNSKVSSGTTRSLVRRLQEAGFSGVVRRAEAYEVVAYK